MAQPTSFKADPEGKAAGEQRIPKERVDAMIAKAKADAEAKAAAAEERARLESERRKELEARSHAPAAPAPKSEERAPLSRAQLRALVDSGEITQDEMDAELERQIEMRIEKRVSSIQDVKTRAAKINTEISQYIERVGDLDNPTSDNHKRVKAEFKALRERDFPNDATTELLALRAVFGDLDKIRIPETGHKERETDKTTHSGAGGEEQEETPSGPGPLKGLSKEYIDHYQKGIDAGRYKGWDDERLIRIQKRALARG
ncbi:hypothetical protein AMJ82_08920 [candidate division TA06 bacterium SM23_40]|uniref:Uncharacterized protein n=1 Tax=candidate division TA06 bacterium SM23_40 TaxID=1703774 RepID=A0A0S8G5M7_UNCT6|nr:MAG: hypothetical protein AMJ82_08920 [candidate division TA06 bacterium SM23_40]